MQELIRVSNLNYHYTDAPAVLHNINLLINEGEYIALIGPNGCGKTTLIRHFNALLQPSSGDVSICGLNTRSTKNILEIRRLVGMIFQNPDNQIVGMSVEEDVAFGPGNLGLPAQEMRRRVQAALEMTGLQGLEKRPPHTLSGGQKQLLALAGMLAMEPKMIALDEPTASLDPDGKNKVLSLLKDLNSRGIGIIHVTHNMEEAALADRVLVMEKGEIIADGSAANILSRVEWLKSLGLAPPRITELLWTLQQQGEVLAGNIFTVEAAAKEIGALLKRLRGFEHV
ncbi:MAG: energy-coupling factor transporter ATPase [Syntrophomonadaceae bacterium]|nr:energy-coupling factor transporter ATPase [Syntrophomonadaceae bacterium]